MAITKNKEKVRKTIVTLRLPMSEYKKIKEISDSTRGGKKGTFVSMNDLIIEAIKNRY